MTVLREILDVRFTLFEPADLDEMASLLATAFGKHEVMAISSGYTHQELVDFVKLLGPAAHRDKLTVVARDIPSGAMIGALLSEDFCAEAPEGFDRVSDKFRPTLTLLEQLDTQYRQGKDIRPGHFLHLYMLGVKRTHTGKKIGQHLLTTSLENAAARGYRMALAEATGAVSQSICRKLGFVERLSVSYQDYTYQGRRVFAHIEGVTGTVLMDRSLVPEA